MLIISATQSTKVATTFYEKATIPNPYYTWKLVDRNTFQEYFFYSEDFSNAPTYYNYFTISVGTLSATAGYVDIKPGEFHYTVYQQTTPYDLTDSDTIVEVGILICNGTSSTLPSYVINDNATVVVWNNI